MILDVARHKFYEGVATLLLIATIVAVRVALLPTIAADAIVEGGAPLVAPLARFESAHPVLTALLAALFCVQSALRLARATVRYNIYGTSSMAAISLTAQALGNKQCHKHRCKARRVDGECSKE